jgi:hypothetical protein
MQLTIPEVWRPVSLYDVYQDSYRISNYGRCMSLDRTVYEWSGYPRRIKGKILKLSINYGSEYMYRLHPGLNGSSLTEVAASWLVADAFIMPIIGPELSLRSFTVRRINGDLFDCSAHNLYLDPKDQTIFSKVDLLEIWTKQLEVDWRKLEQ